VKDLLLLFRLPAAGLRLAVCATPRLSLEAATRHGLAEGSAAALAQGMAGALLLAATEQATGPGAARVDLQLDCSGPLRGLLVDADGAGAVRGLTRVNDLDRRGVPAADGPVPAPRQVGHGRFDARPLLSSVRDEQAGRLSILRASGEQAGLHRALVPFAGGDLAAGLSAFLRSDRAEGGELALEVALGTGDRPAAVAGALLWPDELEPGGAPADPQALLALGARLRADALSHSLQDVEPAAPGNAHALARALTERLSLGPPRLLHEVRPRFACRCSRERVLAALATLPAAELRSMASQDNGARTACDFCGARFEISAQELLGLLPA
jgi:molecular chaperone Hsp33